MLQEMISNRDQESSKMRPKARGRNDIVAGEARSDDEISAALGARIKSLRIDSNLSLEDLSLRSNVSRSMLSKVERGEKSPTLPIIVRIAGGFGMSLSELLGAKPDLADVSVIRASERLYYRDSGTCFERWVLSPAHLDNGLELVLHRIPPGRSMGVLPPYSVPTEKYIVVSEGELTVHVDQRPYVLKAGDSMYFEVKSPYQFTNNDGHLACVYYMTIVRKR